MEQKKIGKFIAQCRREKGYTQASLAEKLGITDRAISKWENGRSLPDASIMQELCGLLNISVDELLSGEHIPPATSKETEENDNITIHESNPKLSKKGKIFLAVAIFTILIIIASFAGTIIGEDIGKFIYNITH